MLLKCVILDMLFTLVILPLEPTGAPQAVTVSVTSSRSISVSWDPVIADDRNGIVKGYKVNYQALPNGDIATKIFKITKEQQNKRQTVTLGNLNEFTNYSIGVLAFTVFGGGPASVGQVVETLEDSKFYSFMPASVLLLFLLLCLFLHLIKSYWTQKQYFRILSVLYLSSHSILFLMFSYLVQSLNVTDSTLITLLNEFTSYSIGALVFTVFGNGPASVGQVVKTLRQQVLHQHSGCSC